MKTFVKSKEYTGKILNYFSYLDDDGVEYIAIPELLKNFYIRELKDELTNHPNLIITNVEHTDIIILEKSIVIGILKSKQKTATDLNASFTLADTVKKLLDTPVINNQKTIDYFNKLNVDDIVEIRVNRIDNFGAMVELVDCPSIRGIVHISEILSGFVNNVHDHFTVGDILKARIVKLQDDLKLNLSTKEFKDKEILDKNIAEEIQFNIEQNKNEVKLPPEYYEIEEYVRTVTGELSNDAKLKLMALIEEYGIFKFTLKISAASQDMVANVGLLFLNKLEQLLEG